MLNANQLKIALVSIPSSRVGTRMELVAVFNYDGFHPLKSGRNPTVEVHGTLKIPCFHPLKSGRNSVTPCDSGWKRRQFPSPQVGSELCRKILLLLWEKRFHPLKSGRNAYVRRGRGGTGNGFHPLKSGRNHSPMVSICRN